MMPVRRDLRFQFTPAQVLDWHRDGRQATHLVNALSVFFPVGERFFIHSLRHYRGELRDPELQQAVTAFIGQEALHGREHESFNRALVEAGLPVDRLEARVHRRLEWFKAHLPPAAQLSITIALEHFTAILADIQLRDPRVTATDDPHIAGLLRWHALEETEHKAVAFDVYRRCVGTGFKAYLLRCAGLLFATAQFVVLIARYQRRLVQADPVARAEGWGGVRRLLRFLFVRPAPVLQALRPWLDYFRPSFHPWDHDNRHLLAQIPDFVAHAETLRPAT